MSDARAIRPFRQRRDRGQPRPTSRGKQGTKRSLLTDGDGIFLALVVERSHSWLNRSRRPLVRWEKRVENYLAFLHLACALLISAKLAVFGAEGGQCSAKASPTRVLIYLSAFPKSILLIYRKATVCPPDYGALTGTCISPLSICEKSDPPFESIVQSAFHIPVWLRFRALWFDRHSSLAQTAINPEDQEDHGKHYQHKSRKFVNAVEPQGQHSEHNGEAVEEQADLFDAQPGD